MEESNDSDPLDDPYTREWYRKQFMSLNFHWQRSMAEEVDLRQQVKLLRKQVATMEEQRRDDMAAIGELRDSMESCRAAYKKIIDDIKEIRNGGSGK